MKGYKHHWLIDFHRDFYECTVCKTVVTNEALLDAMSCDELVHDCLDRIAKGIVCKEPVEYALESKEQK